MSGCSGGAACAGPPFGSTNMKQTQSAKAKRSFKRVILTVSLILSVWLGVCLSSDVSLDYVGGSVGFHFSTDEGRRRSALRPGGA